MKNNTTYIKLLIINIFIILNFSYSQNFPHPINDPNWDLIFEDDFSSSSIDANKWLLLNDVNFGYGLNSWNNDNNHISISNNKLKLTSTYESTPHFGNNFVGGYVRTHQNFNQNDFFEVSCRLQSIPGSFPAAWVWSGIGECDFNDYREIDIMEHFGFWENHIQTGIHFCDGPYVRHNNGGGITKWTGSFAVSNGNFHTYSCFWGINDILFYINNSLHNTVNNNGRVILTAPLAINQAVGAIDNNGTIPSSSNLPASLEVDWVKVYRLRCDNNVSVNEIPDFNTFNYSVKKNISLSGATTVPVNEEISLRAEEFIELRSGFEVPNNTTFSLDINTCD